MFAALALLAIAAAADCTSELTSRGRVSIGDAVELVAMLLPGEHAAEFRARAARVTRLPVEPTAGRARLNYRPRLFDWSVDRAARARLRWNDRAPTTPAERDALIAATIDLVTEANFTPVRRPSVYLRRSEVFTVRNLALVRDKLLYHLFTLGPPEPVTTPPGPLARALRTILRPILPAQFAVIRGVRLTPGHVAAFEADGPAGLYRYVSRREGVELAVRYWFTHLSNLQLVLGAAYVATVAPSLYEAWRYVFDLHLVTIDDRATAVARRMLHAMRESPDRVIANGRRLFETLSPDEQSALGSLFRGAVDR